MAGLECVVICYIMYSLIKRFNYRYKSFRLKYETA